MEGRIRRLTGPAIAVVLLLGMSASPASAVPILNGANGHYYDVVHSGGVTWTAARTAAEGLTFAGYEGHLVTITSQAEQDFIVGNFPSALGTPSTAGYWIGAERTINTNAPLAYTWVTGEAFVYTNWNGGEPNGDAAPAAIHFFGFGSPAGKWNDVSQSYPGTGGFVVEYEAAVPAPAALVLLGAGAIAVAISRRRTS